MKKTVKYWIWLLLAAMLFSAAYLAKSKSSERKTARKDRKQFVKLLHEREQELQAYLQDSTLIDGLVNYGLEVKEIKKLRRKPFSIFLYKGDTLVTWTRNNVIPPPVATTKEGSSFLKLKNGYYEQVVKKAPPYTVIGLLPLRYNYPVKNQYLKGSFYDDLSIPNYYGLSRNPGDGKKEVKNYAGEPLFYLKVRGAVNPHEGRLFKILFLAAIAMLVVFVVRTSVGLSRSQPLTGWLFLLVMLLAAKLALNQMGWPGFISNWQLFDPHYYASPGLAGSLGELLVNILMAAWLAVFFYKKMKLPFLRKTSPFIKITSSSIVTAVILWSGNMVASIFRSLVIDSNISFDINNFLTLDIYSFVGMAGIALLLMSYFLFAQKLYTLVFDAHPKLKEAAVGVVIGVLLYLSLVLLASNSLTTWWLLPWTVLFIALLGLTWRKRTGLLDFSNVVLWLVLFSLSTTVLLINFNDEKADNNRKLYATRIAKEKDPLAEYIFEDIRPKLINDNFIKNYFSNPLLPGKQLTDRVQQLYFRGYLAKYNVDAYFFNEKGIYIGPTKTAFKSLVDVLVLISQEAEATSARKLYYFPKKTSDSYYLADLTINYADSLTGRLFIQLTSKRFAENSIYPELLLEERLKEPAGYENFDYAIYSKYQLSRQSGDFPYPYYYDFVADETEEEYQFSTKGGYEHLMLEYPPDKKVVVSSKRRALIQPVSLFSYLFCFFLLMILLLGILNALVKLFRSGGRIKVFQPDSLRAKIHSLVLAVIFFSFLVIGVVTVIYFTTQYNQYHHQRLMRKVKSVVTDLDYEMRELARSGGPGSKAVFNNDGFEQVIGELSNTHSMDINIYDLNGDVVMSSQPAIFEKALIAEKMDPVAFYKMTCELESQFIQSERIGKLDYLSAYIPVRDAAGDILGFLNLPYFSKEKNLREDISAFMVTLINVYVFLLVGAGFIALFLSNSITRSLSVIGDKLKGVALGKRNEPIDWQNNDEIGILVKEYNKMISELERSANLLAKSERESAWREMAKQVAHEIKNPLTPMRLSIQHLQRALAANALNAKELTQRVSTTLLEQIDNLSHIASEFSNFAKMPKAQNELINLNETLRNVAALFEKSETAQIIINLTEKDYVVFADKNQLIRVFNNLIKNAIQAVPEDRKGEVKIGLAYENGWCTVTVQDNGSGIPDDKKDKVFVPNFTTKSSGMGLGLAMTKNIIESAGGEIRFESTVDVGTTFYVRLPEAKNNIS